MWDSTLAHPHKPVAHTPAGPLPSIGTRSTQSHVQPRRNYVIGLRTYRFHGLKNIRNKKRSGDTNAFIQCLVVFYYLRKSTSWYSRRRRSFCSYRLAVIEKANVMKSCSKKYFRLLEQNRIFVPRENRSTLLQETITQARKLFRHTLYFQYTFWPV